MMNANARKSLQLLLGIVSLLGSSPLASAEWLGTAEAGVRHDSDINNAQMQQDIAADSALFAGYAATGFYPLENGSSLSVTGETRIERYDRYSGLNNLSVGAALAFRKKWALGPYAPWTGWSLSSAHLNYNDNIRNGWRHQIAVRGGERVSERWSVRAGFMYERRTANTLTPDQPGISGDVFTQNSRTLTLDTEHALDDSTFLTGGFLWRRGDIVATTSETANLIASSGAIAADTVFGPTFYAYRMYGTTHGLELGLNHVLSRSSLLRVAISRLLTHAAGENNYAKTIQTVSWVYDFQ